jgi:peptidoglycan/xylan/chitin deacetylase (PgdA/CDA1 family)
VGKTKKPAFALAAALLALAAALPEPAAAADSAVIIMYHRFGESEYPATNVTMEQFRAHIAELKSGGYKVLPVPEIVAAIRDGRELPDRTVGLSVDDAYLSVYERAWPLLREAGLPFTLFVATRAVDEDHAGIMNWDQIREMAAAGVTIGNHSTDHMHMAATALAQDGEDIAHARRRFVAELGKAPELFAYPYGEASLALEKQVKEAGFSAAFGQHSGVLFRGGDFFYLPRFAMNETYADIDRFRLVASALPLPVTDVTPADMLITDNNPPAFGFTVAAPIDTRTLACYASHAGKAKLERIGDARFEVRMTEPFPPGRGRINCTLRNDDGRWRWYGRQFYIRPR